MGTSTSWIAVEGATIEQVARDLDLSVTPASMDAGPRPPDDAYLAALLPTGWVLLICRMTDDGIVAGPALLEKLSRGRRVIACDAESHVMYAASCEWRDGREVWAVIHESAQAVDHLDSRGALPAGWSEPRDALMAQQTDETNVAEGIDGLDYVYDIPGLVAKLVVDYELESTDDDDLTFVTLVATPPRPSKPWWKVW